MTSQKFTTKTASLRTVLLDTRKINSKKVETDELILNGENIEEKIPKFVPKEHVHRCEITEDENYIIYDDMGNLVDCKLDKLVTQNYLFLGRHDITEFSYDLSNLSYGTGMFENCGNLTTFKSSLPTLTAAGGMFTNCNLSEESVENILNSLAEKDNNAAISMTINSLALPKLCEITNTSYQDFHRVYQGTKSIPFKNYTLSVDLKDLPAGYKTVEYLESTGTQFIDTELKLNDKSEIRCELSITKRRDDGNDQGLFGVFQEPSFRAVWRQNGILYFFILERGYEDISIENIPLNEKIKIIFNSSSLRLNELYYNFSKHDSFETLSTAHVFTAAELGHTYRACERIYNFSIYNENNLQLQFIPCIDNLGNPCMFDAVSKQTFRNQDNIDPESDFLYPSSESSTYSLRKEIPTYGRMTEHGIQKLYHLPEDYEGEAEDFIKENNFKELVYTEKPNDGKNYIFHWKETDTQLIVVWTEVEKEELEYV